MSQERTPDAMVADHRRAATGSPAQTGESEHASGRRRDGRTRAVIERVITQARKVAVVGVSPNPMPPRSHGRGRST